MKTLQLLLVAIVTLNLLSCVNDLDLEKKTSLSKRLSPQNTTENAYIPYPGTTPTYPNDSIVAGYQEIQPNMINSNAIFANSMLKFNTLNDFNDVYNQLDYYVENYSGYDAYMSTSTNLDYVDNLLDQLGIDEFQPLRAFESKYQGFVSYRKQLEEEEDNYLNNGGDPTSTNNPEIAHYVNDDIFRSMLNRDGCIMVENVLFKIFPNGVTYGIINPTGSQYNEVNNPYYASHNYEYINSTTNTINNVYKISEGQPIPMIIDDDNMDTIRGPLRLMGSQGCLLWRRQNSIPKKYATDTKRYISTVRVMNMGVYNKAVSKILHYKIKSNGKWKRSRAKLSAKISQIINPSIDECGTSMNQGKIEKFRKRRRVHTTANLGITYPISLPVWLASTSDNYPEVLIRILKDRGQGNNQVKGEPIQQVILTW